MTSSQDADTRCNRGGYRLGRSQAPSHAVCLSLTSLGLVTGRLFSSAQLRATARLLLPLPNCECPRLTMKHVLCSRSR